jgi:hypothetical protein
VFHLKTRSVAEITDEGNVGVEALIGIIFKGYNRYIRRKLAPIATSSTTNPRWTYQKLYLGLGKKTHGK